jgi:hypothetical protein
MQTINLLEPEIQVQAKRHHEALFTLVVFVGGREVITVFHRQTWTRPRLSQHDTTKDKTWETMINWSALGSVDDEMARAFAEALGFASRIAQQLRQATYVDAETGVGARDSLVRVLTALYGE